MQCTPVDSITPTCFAFTCSVKVVVGAQQLALSVRPTVVDARRQVGAHVHLGRDISAQLKSGKKVTDRQNMRWRRAWATSLRHHW